MDRKSFLKLLPAICAAMNLGCFERLTQSLGNSDKLPVLFVGHGSPMNAITDNPFRKKWAELGKTLPVPKAVLCISAHWLTRGTFVTMTDKPKTIHDFGGFPDELFVQQYPAPGAAAFGKMTIEGVKSVAVHEDYEWGLDHGTWSVLINMFPQANVPVFQLSIDESKPPQFHYNLAKELAFLRKKGVLIIGSGNVVHNFSGFGNPTAKPEWAITFDNFVKEKIANFDDQALIDYEKLGSIAREAQPSNDHYLPLMYTIALRDKTDKVEFFNEVITVGTMSMRSVIYS